MLLRKITTHCYLRIWCVYYLYIVFSSKGTHHLWPVPVMSFQDITYHFRVSLSVSKSPSLDSMRWHWLILLIIVITFAPHRQSEVSCDHEGERKATTSYSDYHFLIQSSCAWGGRRCVPVPFRYTTLPLCGSICTLLWYYGAFASFLYIILR